MDSVYIPVFICLIFCRSLGEPASAQQPSGSTLPMCRACGTEAGRRLVPAQSLLNKQLHIAVEEGNLAEAQRLLAHGANPNSQINGDTPLFRAVTASRMKWSLQAQIVRILLKKGAPPNARDAYGRPILMIAASMGNTAVLQILLSRGASIQARESNVPEQTALHAASEAGRPAAVKFLLRHGAIVNVTDKWGVTPLMLAAEGGQENVVDILLENGAAVNVTDDEGNTALLLASAAGRGFDPPRTNRLPAYIAIIQRLLAKKADVHAHNKDGPTALMLGAAWANATLVKLLLDKGADINARDSSGQTALIYAAGRGRLDTVKLLVSRGADPNVQDTNGLTALRQAKIQNYPEVVSFLEKAGAKE
jgi:ankyrin repeat protein